MPSRDARAMICYSGPMGNLIDTIIEALMRRRVGRLEDDLSEDSDLFPKIDTAHFPFDLIEVPGPQAVARWEELSASPDVTPVIIGTRDDDLESLAWPFQPDTTFPPDELSVTLRDADDIDFPTRILTLSDEILEDMIAAAREEGDTAMVELLEADEDEEDWRQAVLSAPWPEPDEIHPQTGPISLDNWKTGRIEEKLLIALVPTDDATELPAMLSWGGWNANPAPAWHVAAFRSWADRYGAVPVVMRRDVIEFKVARRPETRDEALALAREMYAYCPDIVDQGVGTVPALAATLMASDWWYFWWD